MRNRQSKINTFILVTGDLIVLYISLYFALWARNLFQPDQLSIQNHLYPFTIAFVFWIIVFSISGLYDLRVTKNSVTFIERLFKAVIINAVITTLIFYLQPEFKLTPKTNLVLDLLISSFLIFCWRYFYNIRITARVANNVLFFGVSKEIFDTIRFLEENSQFGYKTAAIMLSNHEPVPERFPYPKFRLSRKCGSWKILLI